MTYFPHTTSTRATLHPAVGSDHISAARFGAFGDVLSITAVRTA
jgi:hypothetical protein